MWCHRCKLDVPARQQPPESVLRCGVCAAILPGATPPEAEPAADAPGVQPKEGPSDGNSTAAETAAGSLSKSIPAATGEMGEATGHHSAAPRPEPCPDLHDDQLDDELAEVRLLIRRTSHLIVTPFDADDAFSLADCIEPLRTAQATDSNPPGGAGDETLLPSGRWWAAGGWLLVCLGAMGLVFASVLFTAGQLGAQHSQAVWPLCLLSAFAGQFLVVLGFLLRHGIGRDRASKPARQAAPPAVSTAIGPTNAPEVPSAPPNHTGRPRTATLDSSPWCDVRPHAVHRPPWSETVERVLAPLIERD